MFSVLQWERLSLDIRTHGFLSNVLNLQTLYTSSLIYKFIDGLSTYLPNKLVIALSAFQHRNNLSLDLHVVIGLQSKSDK